MRKSSVQALFRDTAIEVAILSDGGEVESMTAWQSRCVELVERLRRELRVAGYPDEEIQDISYTQCALLDETALRNLPESLRGDWEVNPLQVRFFNSYNAGEVIYERIGALLRKKEPSLDLAAAYALILNLGFQGRYVDKNDEERLQFIDGLARLRALTFNDGFLVSSGQKMSVSFWRSLSPLAWMLIAAGLPFILWLILDSRLQAQIQDILKSLG